MTKMNFVYYCADDMLNGTMTLSIEEELAYRRIVDLIYSTSNQLEDNGRMSWMTKLEDKWQSVRDKLVTKNKIQIENGFIKVERCTEEIDKAKDNYSKKQKAARARWDANAYANADANHKPLTTNHKSNNHNLFEEFWNVIRFKKGKEDARKVFNKINFDKEKLNNIELANKYNEYLDNLPDYQDTPKWVQGWLSNRRWEDEDSLTPVAFAKKYNVPGTFVKFEDDLYYFKELDSFGAIIYKYNKHGKIVRNAEGEEGKTKKTTTI
jgi:uncharacterized protein YdaU (DUF1376 family)